MEYIQDCVHLMFLNTTCLLGRYNPPVMKPLTLVSYHRNADEIPYAIQI